MRRLISIALAAACLGVGLALSCGGDDDSGGGDASPADDDSGPEIEIAPIPAMRPCEQSFDWLKAFNIYVFGSADPDYLAAVSGNVVTWSVYHGGFNEEQFQYVQTLHSMGVKVDSNFPTMQAYATVTHDEGFARDSACRDLLGVRARAYWIEPERPYLPCHNNPGWQEFLRARLREHIDGGADAVHLDEVEGIGGHLYIFGFCEYCMAGFRAYLAERFGADELQELFGIADVAAFDYRRYLLDHGAISIFLDPNPSLRREFVRFELLGRRRQIADLIAEGQGYSGRNVAFSANTFFMSANKHPLIPLLDFLVFENTLSAPGGRGKYFGTYMLAQALKPCAPPVMTPNIINVALLSDNDWRLIPHWLLEAAAVQGGFLLPYHQYGFGGTEYHVAPELLAPYTDFLAATGPLTAGARRVADVAILYDYTGALEDYLDYGYFFPYADFGPTEDGYFGLALALQELHVPFDVVYEGDGELVEKDLTAAELRPYTAVLAPQSSLTRDRTRQVLSEYERAGGRVVDLGDLPLEYWRASRNNGLRESIFDQVAAVAEPSLTTDADPLVGVMLYRQKNDLVIHLVNYDYQLDRHEFAARANLNFAVRLPPGIGTSGKVLRSLAPNEPPQELDYVLEDGVLRFVVPELGEYRLLVF